MRTLTTLILLSSVGLATAQSGPDRTTVTQTTPTRTEKTGLVVLPTPDGAHLRWYLPGDVIPTGGFVVQVTGTSQRDIPVASPQPFTAASGISREEYDAITSVYTAPLTADSSFERAIFNLNVVARPALARALGIQTTLTGLQPGAYTATVYAVNGGARTRVGGASFRTGPTPPVPAPTNLTVTGGAPARLTWTAAPPDDSHAVVAYNVFRAAATGSYTRLEPAPFFITREPGGDVFTDEESRPGQTYRYQVSAVDLFGRESAPSAPVTLTAREDTPIPSPEIASATPGNRTVTLAWTPGTDPRVRSVIVLRGTTPDTLTAVAKLTPTDRSYVDQVEGGVPYLYALAAADDTGQVSGRGTLTAATGQNLTPPAAPAGVTVTPGRDTLTLTWTANTERDLTGYWVYRSEGDPPTAPEFLLTGLPITGTTYVDAIPQGVQTRYHYRVLAVNSSRVNSLPSAPAAAALLDVTPPPPPLLQPAAVTAAGVTLTWAQSEVPDLARFEITRAAPASDPAVVGSVDAPARTYTDATGVPGVAYRYSLRSLDRTGNRSEPAAPVTASRPAPAGSTRPTDVRAALLPEGGVRLTWTAGAAPARYVVYRLDGTRLLEVSDVLPDLTYTDPDGKADSRYVLRALSSEGEISAPTEEVSVTP
ncbi:fibronectin type III domain-containing protein [Deinococcus sedimenti]|uniref:Fibronectin type-III domain-containing protein n=1 Tax=Deinococcus sedimenti TaxID=1867090 RepID=A0ABQ2S701_9DEIO|nr:hypothetical protein [Deinococcus sedimenti]GGS03877.1 hypothetical protein GCM10008960_33060 [Deinococcus sedimenti]